MTDRAPQRPSPTRSRLIAVSMKLFGIQGYAGTSVSEIEAAAGLAAGSGSMYRHFPSKEALLSAGIREQIAEGAALIDMVRGLGTNKEASLREGLAQVAVAGLRRLDQERDFNRILIKDLARFPELLEIARNEEIGRIHAAVADWLKRHAARDRRERDWMAMATVVIGAVSHYWLMCDIFGAHPSEVQEERFIESLVDLVTPALAGVEAGGRPATSAGRS